jgi:5-histidylcysteine sulfoxide synthase/putative 4-mercaptohistidine N1-methyltranferase
MKTLNQQVTPLLSGDSISAKREEIKQYFQNTWASYDALFALINNDNAYYLRPEPLRHPLIFYYGHTATFYINKLILGKYIKQRVNEKLEAICAVGVDEMSWDDLDSRHYQWPSVLEVRQYRQQVATQIAAIIDTMPLTLPIKQDSLAWVILMGIEHERIHLETSSVIMRMLPLEHLNTSDNWPACSDYGVATDNALLAVSGKLVHLGKAVNDQTYGWDNEYGHQDIEVKNFSASQFLVSNQEFLAFVEDDGYQRPEYWTEEGQQWLSYTKASMPRFWRKMNGQYKQRNLLNEIPLPLNWPVEVNYLEAKAFCHWKSKQTNSNIRLPTEAEWYCLRDNIAGDITAWTEIPANINLAYYASSCPVNRFKHGDFYDVIGNVWQWTESAIDGYEGFTVHPLYDDFSTPTFDGKHNIIKGGSWISTGNEAIKSSRYAFRRHFYQHAGFRYIASEHTELPTKSVNLVETNRDVCQQLESHYGKNNFQCFATNYYQALANEVKHYLAKYSCKPEKLLDIGCGVGRCSFELAEQFRHVDAIDFSARYIQHGVRLQQQQTVRYLIENEGEIFDFNAVNLADINLPAAKNILFSQGDASNLKAKFTGYDAVLAQNIIENSYQPKRFLTEIVERINTQGLLFLVSSYRFDPTKTDVSQRLGGHKVNGENVTGFDAIEQQLTKTFDLLDQQSLTQLLKENQRHFKLINMHLTVWRKKEG